MRKLYIAIIFLSSFLLFLIQPMVSKLILPILGGSPAVWNTSMIFYQLLLLVGYYYAFISNKILGTKKQAKLHLMILILTLISIPIFLHEFNYIEKIHSPISWLLITLLLSIGMPFFALSANAPVIQRWYSNSSASDSKKPYFLYSASNLGNFIALLTYPFAIEPYISLNTQMSFLSFSYLLFVGGVFIAAFMLFKNYEAENVTERTEKPEAPSNTQKFKWILYAFVPSSLLLGVTSYITDNIGAVPLIWLTPLAIYLLSYVFAFAKKPHFFQSSLKLHKIAILTVILIMAMNINAPNYIYLLHLISLFIISMTLHGQLAKESPSTEYLTEYYLWMSVGGVLGGCFNSLLAPCIFNSVYEYPLILVLAYFLHPSFKKLPTKKKFYFEYVIPLILLIFIVYDDTHHKTLYVKRNFFGVTKVVHNKIDNTNILFSGKTKHGLQSLEPELKLSPKAQYSVLSEIFTALNKDKTNYNVGVIGLGVGTVACHGQTQQRFDFFEVNPIIKKIAENKSFFTFLSECPAKSNVIIGDGRAELTKVTDGRYGFIILDAYSSDSTPVHLLTIEAFKMYFNKLHEDGVIALHISNHIGLSKIATAIAYKLGVPSFQKNSKAKDRLEENANWLVLTKNKKVINELQSNYHDWHHTEDQKANIWTDNYANVLDYND